MILVYCHKNSQRIQYILDLIVGNMLAMKWRLTNNVEEFRSFDGGRICYDKQPLSDREVFIHSGRLLFEKGIHHVVPEVLVKNGLPVLFPNVHQSCQAGYDLFSAVFYLVTRYEEYLPHVKDRFGRFEAAESLSFRKGFLHIPVADHYVLHLRQLLSRTFPTLHFPERAFSFIPTIDIDVAYAYKGRGLIRTIAGSIKDAANGNNNGLLLRFKVLTGRKSDPYDTYDDQLAMHGKYRCKPWYFFLCGDYGSRDKNISYFSPFFQKLVIRMADYAHIGIHPSFASNFNSARLPVEIERLSSLIKAPVKASRQHYLMLRLPDTYRLLISNHIEADFSMGYASQPGFRAGTCNPFKYYDLDQESLTDLTIYPLAVMDGTLRDYLGLSTQEATEKIHQLVCEVKKVKGTFISLWHNESLADRGYWTGWKAVYEELLKMGTSTS